MNAIVISLSKDTKSLQAACRELIQERDKVRGKCTDLLSDDKTSLDKAESTLASLRARSDMIDARLPRRRGELYAALVKDVATMYEAAEAKLATARDDLRQAKADFREKILMEHSKNSAQKILEDPGLQSKSIARAQAELDQAREMVREAGTVRGMIDKVEAEKYALTKATHIAGESYIKPIEHYYRNAAKWCPELFDDKPKSEGWKIQI